MAALEAGDGTPVEVQLTREPGDGIAITRRLLADGFRDIIVLGGDGTVGEVAAGCVRSDGSGMVRNDIVLSIIHQGTGGDLAHGLGIPKDQGGAVAVALGGAMRRIDVGVATFNADPDVPAPADVVSGSGGVRRSRGFASTANVGMAADVVQQVTGHLKRLGNSGSFAIATVSCLVRNRPRMVRVITDEGVESALDIVDIDICNNRFMGGGMLVAPDARLDDGLLDVVLIAAAGRLRLLRTFPKIYSGRHVADPLVRVERTVGVSIDAIGDGAQQGVVLDGELVGCTPATFRTIPSALSVRVPHAEG